MAKITALEAVRKALKSGNAALAGNVADKLRFNLGYTYAMIAELVEKAGYTVADWEELMYEAEFLDGYV